MVALDLRADAGLRYELTPILAPKTSLSTPPPSRPPWPRRWPEARGFPKIPQNPAVCTLTEATRLSWRKPWDHVEWFNDLLARQ